LPSTHPPPFVEVRRLCGRRGDLLRSRFEHVIVHGAETEQTADL
jgi:hypothetical protein